MMSNISVGLKLEKINDSSIFFACILTGVKNNIKVKFLIKLVVKELFSVN